MANWLEKAIGRKSSSAATVPFERACDCGASHNGLRAERAKRLICAQCGEPHFILPVNQYPVSERRFFQPKLVEVEESVEAPPAEDRSEVIRHPVRKKKPRLEPKPVEPPAIPEEKRRISPFVPILAAFLVIVGFMSVWFVRSRAQEQAEQTLQEATAEGEAHLVNGDFAAAYTELKRAMKALDVLGIEDSRSEHVRGLFLEADAGAHLLPASPIELVEDAEQTMAESSAEAWKERFRVAYAGRWFLLHLPLTGNGSSAPRLPIDVNGTPVVFSGIDALIDDAQKASLSEALIAGQLTDCRKHSEGIPEWRIAFDPETAFLWSGEVTVHHLGIIPDEDEIAAQMRNLVRRQARLQGVESDGAGGEADVVQ